MSTDVGLTSSRSIYYILQLIYRLTIGMMLTNLGLSVQDPLTASGNLADISQSLVQLGDNLFSSHPSKKT